MHMRVKNNEIADTDKASQCEAVAEEMQMSGEIL